MTPQEAARQSRFNAEQRDIKDRENKRIVREKLEAEHAAELKSAIKDVNKQIREAVNDGRLYISITYQYEQGWLARSLSSHYSSKQYKTATVEDQTDYGDSAAPCVVNTVLLRISWDHI